MLSEGPGWSLSRRREEKHLEPLWNAALKRRCVWLGCPSNRHASFSAWSGCINPPFPRDGILLSWRQVGQTPVEGSGEAKSGLPFKFNFSTCLGELKEGVLPFAGSLIYIPTGRPSIFWLGFAANHQLNKTFSLLNSKLPNVKTLSFWCIFPDVHSAQTQQKGVLWVPTAGLQQQGPWRTSDMESKARHSLGWVILFSVFQVKNWEQNCSLFLGVVKAYFRLRSFFTKMNSIAFSLHFPPAFSWFLPVLFLVQPNTWNKGNSGTFCGQLFGIMA